MDPRPGCDAPDRPHRRTFWAAFLATIALVLTYFGFVVAERQDLEIDRTVDESATAPSTESRSTS